MLDILEPEARAKQIAQLRFFLKWLAIMTLGISPLNLVFFAFNRDPWYLWSPLSLLCFVGIVGVAYQQLLQEHFSRAVSVTSAGMMALTVTNILIVPVLFPLFIVTPTIILALVLPYVDAVTLKRISVAVVVTTVVIFVIPQFWNPSTPLDDMQASILLILIAPLGTMSVALLLWQFRRQLVSTLSQMQTLNTALYGAQSRLEQQVAQRTADLQAALREVETRAAEQGRLLREVNQQRATIYELSVPVLPVSEGTLVMPLVGALDDVRLQQIQDQALKSIEMTGARTLLIDLSGVPMIDTQVASGLIVVVQAARLLGTHSVLVGIRPEIAQTLVGLGIYLDEFTTAADLQQGLSQQVLA